jgi:hypothetical protein
VCGPIDITTRFSWPGLRVIGSVLTRSDALPVVATSTAGPSPGGCVRAAGAAVSMAAVTRPITAWRALCLPRPRTAIRADPNRDPPASGGVSTARAVTFRR